MVGVVFDGVYREGVAFETKGLPLRCLLLTAVFNLLGASIYVARVSSPSQFECYRATTDKCRSLNDGSQGNSFFSERVISSSIY